MTITLAYWLGRCADALRVPVVQNALSLYGVQWAFYLIPLVTVPYLCRVLGADGWGRVAFSQSFGAVLILLIEYGFALSGTREVSGAQQATPRLSTILSRVHGAKLLLSSTIVIVALALRPFLPIFQKDTALFWITLLWAIVHAFNMMWFFLGIERAKLIAAIDVISKTLSAICIFAMVHTQADYWRVLAIQTFWGGAAFLVACLIAYRIVPFQVPTFTGSLKQLWSGRSMVVYRIAECTYTNGAAFLLGTLVDTRMVGFFAAADKICRVAVFGMLEPLQRALFPRLVHLASTDIEAAADLSRRSAILSVSLSIVACSTLFLSAPIVLPLLVGKGYEPAVNVLRILALTPPAIAIRWLVGLQWMVPLREERTLTAVIVISAGVFLAAVLVLVPNYAHIGMALAIAFTEFSTAISLLVILRIRRQDPWRMGTEIPTRLK